MATDLLTDAELRYRDAVARRDAIVAAWEAEGRRCSPRARRGSSVEHPYVRMLRLHDVLVDRLAAAVRVRHRGPEPSAVPSITRSPAAKLRAAEVIGAGRRGVTYAAGSEVAHFAEFCADASDPVARTAGRASRSCWSRGSGRMLGEALAYDAGRLAGVAVGRDRRSRGRTGRRTLLAALALYRLLTIAGRPEILLAAPSDRVAGRLFDAAARFVRRSPELSRAAAGA